MSLADAIACVKAGQLKGLCDLLASEGKLASEADEDGMLLIHHACRRKQEAAIEVLLLAYPPGMMHTDKKGWTPLHWAVSRRAAPSTLRCLLLREPAAASTADGNGSLPLHVAAAAGSTGVESMQLLIDAHADGTRALDGEGRLPLHYAVSRRAAVDVVACLLDSHPEGALCVDGLTGELPASLASAHKAGAEVIAAVLAAQERAAQAAVGTVPPQGGASAFDHEGSLDAIEFDAVRQLFHNCRLDAPNAWQVALPPALTEEAAAIFERARLAEAFARLWEGSDAQLRQCAGPAACFLATRVSRRGESGQWRSDITWISVDDPPTYRAFEGLFSRSGLAQRFAPIVPHDHALRLYTAFYVVRTRCAGTYLHTDFSRAVGLSAMVMMTPLDDFEPEEGFHLLYEAGDPDAPPPSSPKEREVAAEVDGQVDHIRATAGASPSSDLPRGDAVAGSTTPSGDSRAADDAPGATARSLRQYTYRKGTALVFSSRFRHSTQPGRARAAPDSAGLRPHVYLCFVFGTDRSEHWPSIVQALEYLQSRMIARPDGTVVYNPGDEDNGRGGDVHGEGTASSTAASSTAANTASVGSYTTSAHGGATTANPAAHLPPTPSPSAPSPPTPSPSAPSPAAASIHRALQLPPSHHNAELGAPNVWRFPVPAAVIDEAGAIFRRCGLHAAFKRLKSSDERHQRLRCADHAGEGGGGERFFLLRCRPTAATHTTAGSGGGGGFYSDITWISVDDAPTHALFDRLFRQTGVAERCQRFVDCSPGGRLTVYSAFFVVRTCCEAANFHVDYAREVGCNALTLMTPLDDFDETQAFQLLYRQGGSAEALGAAALGAASQRSLPAAGMVQGDVGHVAADHYARYTYRKGEAIVFGASFVHSTEPGKARDPQKPHVYLCFTFGTDKPEHWPAIAQTIDGYQSRMLTRPDGSMVLSSWAAKQGA